MAIPSINAPRQRTPTGAQPYELDPAPRFQLGGGQVYTAGAPSMAPVPEMTNLRNDNIDDWGGGWNQPTPVPPPQAPPPIPLPTGPMPTIPPGNVPPPMPVPMPPPEMGPTAENPLAPLNNYQNQTMQSGYQAPTFQGSNTYQAANVNAPQVELPPLMGYTAQSGQAP